MRVQEWKDQDELSREAAAYVLRELALQPGLLLGAVTGASPTRTYERLARKRSARPDLFRRFRVLKLDEWLGLRASHPATSEAFVRARILAPLGVDRSRYEGWACAPADPEAECRRISRWLDRHGPMDVCLLGLGRNGHLLMNEPAAALDPGPHVARLAPSTRRHSMLQSLKTPPRYGLTLGLGDILRARRILLLVSGRHKAAPLRRMLTGEVSTRCPASLLWLHPDATVYFDREAGGRLANGRRRPAPRTDRRPRAARPWGSTSAGRRSPWPRWRTRGRS
jgi:putative deaminase/isomerase